MVYIGIDIGKKGAIAVLYPDGEVETHLFPMKSDNSYDLPKMWRAFQKIEKHVGESICVIEDVYCVGGASAQSTWSFAEGKAYIESFLVAMGFEYYKVRPKAWQKVIFAQFPKTMKDTKEKSINFTKEHYPKAKLLITPRHRREHDGIADAVCMGHYGKLKYK